MRNVEYILTAEFHIDKGPTLRHQYPNPIPGSQNMLFLPELMLPDQIHKREEDFTLFFLHRNTTTGEFQYVFNKATCEGEPYYLYTLVNNVKDTTFKRGSIIKSISVVTRLSYFKSFKPLLLICLDKYFKSDDISVLEELYQAINEKNFNLVNGPPNQMLIIKKLLITSILDLPITDKIYYDEVFRNKLLGIHKSSTPNDELFIRKDLSYNSIVTLGKMKIPIKIPMINLPDTIGDYLNPTDLNFKQSLINILNAKLSLITHNGQTAAYKNNELTIYGQATPPIITLINAVLTGKKIIFLSYEQSSGYIIDHVLLLLKIITGGGILSGLLTHYNMFPMIDVSKIDLLEECESYIAGTINPFFKNHDKLWDILYDLDTNELFLSSEYLAPTGSHGYDDYKNSIISEDAKFLSNLQMSLFNYNDDLSTIQLIFRRHLNEIIRILLSSKNFNSSLSPKSEELTLLMDGIGYYWSSDTNKLLEVSCYQVVSKKFHDMLYQGKLFYTLLLPNLANELNLMIDLQYHLQSLSLSSSSPMNSTVQRINEREIWFNILKYLISGKSLEIFLLITYLIPPNSSTLMQSSSLHGGNITIFDKNKGIELLLINLFNQDDQVKSNIILILQELQDNFLCGWCLDEFIKSNMIYEIAFNDLIDE